MRADPLWILVIAILLGALFLVGAASKAVRFQPFAGVVESYRVVPATMVLPAARTVVVLELLAGLGAAFVLATGVRAGLGGVVFLLAVYALMLAVNLLRGNDRIDCGCSGFAARPVSISWWLVARNTVLAGVAAAAMLLPEVPRTLGAADWIAAAGSIAALPLLYAGLSQWTRLRASEEDVR